MDCSRTRTTHLVLPWRNPARKRMLPIQIGGVEDHVHVLAAAPATLAPSKIPQLLKGPSSLWIHATFPTLRNFAWQDGYAVFSVSKSVLPEVATYIKNQREHHRARTFKVEYETLLKRHEVSYDPKYLFD